MIYTKLLFLSFLQEKQKLNLKLDYEIRKHKKNPKNCAIKGMGGINFTIDKIKKDNNCETLCYEDENNFIFSSSLCLELKKKVSNNIVGYTGKYLSCLKENTGIKKCSSSEYGSPQSPYSALDVIKSDIENSNSFDLYQMGKLKDSGGFLYDQFLNYVEEKNKKLIGKGLPTISVRPTHSGDNRSFAVQSGLMSSCPTILESIDCPKASYAANPGDRSSTINDYIDKNSDPLATAKTGSSGSSYKFGAYVCHGDFECFMQYDHKGSGNQGASSDGESSMDDVRIPVHRNGILNFVLRKDVKSMDDFLKKMGAEGSGGLAEKITPSPRTPASSIYEVDYNYNSVAKSCKLLCRKNGKEFSGGVFSEGISNIDDCRIKIESMKNNGSAQKECKKHDK